METFELESLSCILESLTRPRPLQSVCACSKRPRVAAIREWPFFLPYYNKLIAYTVQASRALTRCRFAAPSNLIFSHVWRLQHQGWGMSTRRTSVSINEKRAGTQSFSEVHPIFSCTLQKVTCECKMCSQNNDFKKRSGRKKKDLLSLELSQGKNEGRKNIYKLFSFLEPTELFACVKNESLLERILFFGGPWSLLIFFFARLEEKAKQRV